MQRPRREAPAYSVVLPIETDRGPGETRRIGSSSVTFVTAEAFAAGDTFRFAMSLQARGTARLEVTCTGHVRTVSAEGGLFIVDASIDETRIRLAEER